MKHYVELDFYRNDIAERRLDGSTCGNGVELRAVYTSRAFSVSSSSVVQAPGQKPPLRRNAPNHVGGGLEQSLNANGDIERNERLE
jgi:hypothetical protein